MDRRIDGERPKIPAVDADDRGTRPDCPGRFLDVMYFHQCSQPQLVARPQQGPQLAISQRGHNQKGGIRAERCRFLQLVLRDDEVLAQDGDVDRGPDLLEVLGRSIEERRLRENGDGCRSSLSIGRCVRRRIVVAAKNSFGGRPPLALGDDARRLVLAKRGREPGTVGLARRLARGSAPAVGAVV